MRTIFLAAAVSFNGCVMISQKAKYALRALAALAQADPEAPMLISEIALQQSIPKKFLEQILLDLKRSGIVLSRSSSFGTAANSSAVSGP